MFWQFISILKSENESSLTELIPPLILALSSFGPLLLYCEFGSAVTDEFESFSNELYQCKWYLYPIEIKQMMVIFIAETQDTVFVQGFGNIVCVRDSFKKVNKK